MSSNRRKELNHIQTYLAHCDTEITMILQSLQWDRKSLITDPPMITCIHDAGHAIPIDKTEEHEKECWLKCQGYSNEDTFLPDPLDCNANTIVKLSAENIQHIIENASKNDPNFKKVTIDSSPISQICSEIKGNGCEGPVPLTLERLQATFTADERRAIHDAVVASVPTCHNLSDLALVNTNSVKNENETKSRVEILAELRDMKRRRTKYRVATKTKKYSDVLRDVIKNQMELYTDVQIEKEIRTSKDNSNGNTHLLQIKREKSSSVDRDRKRQHYHDYKAQSASDISRNIERNNERSNSKYLLTTEGKKRNEDHRRYQEKYDNMRNHGNVGRSNKKGIGYREDNYRHCHVDPSDRTRHRNYNTKRDDYHVNERRERNKAENRKHDNLDHRSDKYHANYDSYRREYKGVGRCDDKYASRHKRYQDNRACDVRGKREKSYVE